jgi:hypothetical protein
LFQFKKECDGKFTAWRKSVFKHQLLIFQTTDEASAKAPQIMALYVFMHAAIRMRVRKLLKKFKAHYRAKCLRIERF